AAAASLSMIKTLGTGPKYRVGPVGAASSGSRPCRRRGASPQSLFVPARPKRIGYLRMTLDIHRPYPGVALVVTDRGSVLLGAPADAFKATKKYCADRDLPFPRELVAPQQLLVEAAPQFNPE